jgi:iron complex transport system ATP-binding protein
MVYSADNRRFPGHHAKWVERLFPRQRHCGLNTPWFLLPPITSHKAYATLNGGNAGGDVRLTRGTSGFVVIENLDPCGGSMSELGLAADGVAFGYSRSGPVLEAVSAVVPRGGVIGILGPNGSGKTTLLRLLAGLQSPWRGQVRLDGVDLKSMGRAAVARRIAVVPQETQLAFDYTVLELAVMGRYPHLGTFDVEGPEDLSIALDALRATGTDRLASRLFNTLSGGEKQRVIIAAALAQFSSRDSPCDTGTEVLLLDEPTASLDLAYQLEIRSILLELNRTRGLTIVISTHDLNLAAGLCRDLVLLDRGRVLAAGPVRSMLEPALIRTLYDVEVDVSTHPRTGHLTVVPVARADHGMDAKP